MTNFVADGFTMKSHLSLPRSLVLANYGTQPIPCPHSRKGGYSGATFVAKD